jgi:hypothetical protein
MPNIDSGFESGELTINRINETQGLSCNEESSIANHVVNNQPANMHESIFSVQDSHSSLWYNPEQSGHGISVYLFDDNRIIVIWYVYDNNGNPIWLFGTGVQNGDKALLDVSSKSGAMFPPNFNSKDVISNYWGQFELEFNDCNNGVFKWLPDLSTGYIKGEMDVSRLIQTTGLDCD